ncbi:MAG: GAF domain-containing protein [Bacteroidota bacterium]|nr:GAF domain-containing protein [Bacteroidota bacterium]
MDRQKTIFMAIFSVLFLANICILAISTFPSDFIILSIPSILSYIPLLYLIFSNNKVQSDAPIISNKVESMINEFSIKQSIAKDEEERKIQLANKIDQFIANNSLKITKKEQYEVIIRKLCLEVNGVQGAFFTTSKKDNIKYITLVGSFAYAIPESQVVQYEFGEGISGTVAKEGKAVHLKNIPDGYLTVLSGLGKSNPKNLLIEPILNKNNETIGVIEIATFHELTELELNFIHSIIEKIIIE